MMLDLIKELRELQASHGRRIAKYAKGKRSDPERLKGLRNIAVVPLDTQLIELYDRFDGAEPPTTIWAELGYFLGHFNCHSCHILEILNRASRNRDSFPLGDEVVFSQGRKALHLNLIALGSRSILAANLAMISDVRYPAFDSIEAMLRTYIDALRDNVWTFSDDGTSIFDHEGFLEVAKRYNRFPIYWERLVEGKIDFKKTELEQGKIRPRLDPISGRELLVQSGYGKVVDAFS